MNSLRNDQEIIVGLNGELQELREEAWYIADMLVPDEDPEAPTPLLERLKAIPNKVKSLMKETAASGAKSVLALVRLHWPALNLKLVGTGMGCTQDKFDDLIKEVAPVADKVAAALTCEKKTMNCRICIEQSRIESLLWPGARMFT
ncbi:hypothetical protein BAE44_0019137 [Dichanthelium oligosanthes]|uniref:Uncharacterized protein n=1 Tax=Dichanthelium oligosanthes TaxID=888268 RepID=A0A1E5V476_9POAL|nr:hypothetical protein BAE44_0019137 [Dichanthelium oligosanthes]